MVYEGAALDALRDSFSDGGERLARAETVAAAVE